MDQKQRSVDGVAVAAVAADRFALAVDLVLRHEGGYSNDPADPGGETKWGISRRAHPNIEIKTLTREQAVALYRAEYWDRYHFDRIEHPVLAAKVFDVAVNVGPGRALRWLQRAAGVSEDGFVGPLTASQVNLAEPLGVLGRFLGLACRYYLALNNKRFENGWLRRLFDF